MLQLIMEFTLNEYDYICKVINIPGLAKHF